MSENKHTDLFIIDTYDEDQTISICQDPEMEMIVCQMVEIGDANYVEALADAQRIVTTWNNHDQLVEALKGLTEYFEWAINDPKFHEYVKAKEAINQAAKI